MRGFYLLITLLLAGQLWAQHQELTTDTLGVDSDSITLAQAFKKGRIHVHARYFFMATQNRRELSDYYANAVGGGIKYETAPFHGFQAGVGGFFIYNIGSSALSKPDPKSGQFNRYEIGLFDLNDPHNKDDIDRLEELYIRYGGKKGSLTFGKQLINTPFINLQDGRMRPTETEGVYGQVQVHDKWNMEGGWIYKVSPRSTVRWYNVAGSIGVYTQGLNLDGSRGDYAGNVASKGVGLLGFRLKPVKGVQVKAFEQFVHNVFHTTFLQADFEQRVGAQKWIGALQYIHQGAIGEGGNAAPSKTYFDPANKVHILGARAGWKKDNWQATVNYTRIFKGGRFTAPREWGTEPLFTFLSRERNEGTGDVNALMVQIKDKVLKERLQLEVGYGHYYLPDISNAALNKYGLPSYRQLKIWGDYHFGGGLKGLDLALLFVYKGKLGTSTNESRYVINKVGMASYNLIMNYNF